MDDSGCALELHVGAHPLQLSHVHIALRKNILRDGADSFCSGEKRAHLRLHVGRKTGIRFRRDLERLHLSIGRNRDRTISCFDSVSALGQRVSDSADVFRHDTFDRHTFPADRASDEERAGLDSIGNDVVFGAMQLGHAFNDQTPRASTLDLRAHLVEEIGEIDDFRFGGGAFDHRGAFGENGRHQDVIGSKNGRAELSAKIDDRAGKFRREHLYIPVFHTHRRTERFEALEMQIDRAVANDAAAWERDGRLFAASQQGTQHAN